MKQMANRALFGLPFNPEDEGDMFLRYVGRFSANYMAIYPQEIELFITTAVRTSNPSLGLFVG
jgi:hypothetical protein